MKISAIPQRIKSFLKEVYIELRKVNWLNRRDLFRYTMIVIAITFTVALFLGGLDYVFTYLLKRFVLYRGY